MEKIDVLLADDQQLFMDGIVALNSRVNGFNIIGQATDGKELIKLLKILQPKVILLDLEMPGMDGLATIPYLKNYYPEIKIIVLSGHNEEGMIRESFEKGAHGYLLKDSKIEVIIHAVEFVSENGFYFNRELSKYIDIKINNAISDKVKRLPFEIKPLLTEREVEVLQLISEEYTNQEIADRLFLSVKTVETYKGILIKKTNSKNIIGAIKFGLKNKIIK